MRLIDAEPIEQELFKQADKALAKNPYERASICAFRRAFEMILNAPTVSKPPNNILTLEELREMDGEPVWLQSQGLAHYDILTGFTTSGVTQFYTAALPSENYGKTWLAYRRKPEEGTI